MTVGHPATREGRAVRHAVCDARHGPMSSRLARGPRLRLGDQATGSLGWVGYAGDDSREGHALSAALRIALRVSARGASGPIA